MHIFITGVAGFLGSHLAEHFLKKNYTVTGNDTLVGGSMENISHLSRLNFYKTKCEDLDAMTKITKGVDVICHTAAYAHEGLSSVSPKLVCENNVVGSVSVFTAGIINKVKRIVYCSSMARYGNVQAPYKEDQEVKPADPYGVSKVAAELILKILSNTHNFEYNIAVPHNIIGPKQKYDDAYRNVASIMINLILQKRRPIIYGDGNQQRCFSDIKDCIAPLEKLIIDPKIFSETVNIGPDEESVTINNLFQIISNKLKFNQQPIYHKKRPNEVYMATCSSEKARKILNYKTSVNLNDSIDSMINYIKERGAKEFQYNYKIEIDNHVTPETWSKKLF
jgi:UDP-glucose 4-epimerase|tara:strand:- start:1109 stop:2116 length:1008 start_codon:yes stop_codon:yes gene_type:complete